MAKKRRGGGGRKGFTFPVAVGLGFAPLAGAMYRGFASGDANYGGLWGAIREGCQQFGIDPAVPGGGFNAGQMLKGMTPIIGGVLLHKAASRLGINRAIAQAGIPILRI